MLTAQVLHVCHTCGDVLHAPLRDAVVHQLQRSGCYKEAMLDKTQPGGVREIYFCEEHWHAWHRRYQEPPA